MLMKLFKMDGNRRGAAETRGFRGNISLGPRPPIVLKAAAAYFFVGDVDLKPARSSIPWDHPNGSIEAEG
jgi:hypothetical protein